MANEIRNAIHAAGSVVGATGVRFTGDGFTSARTGVGTYTITLDRLIDATECEIILSSRGAPPEGSRSVIQAAGGWSGAGALRAGSFGFTVVRTGVGLYTVTMATALSQANGSFFAMAESVAAWNFVHTSDILKDFTTVNLASVPADRDFNFIAVRNLPANLAGIIGHVVQTSDTVKTIQTVDSTTGSNVDQDFDFLILRSSA